MRWVVIGIWVGLLMPAAPATAQSPRAEITDGPPAQTESREATFAFRSTGFSPLSSFECRLDGGAWAACTSPHALKDLVGGPHEFAVRLAGLLADKTPAVRAWTVQVRTQVLPPVLPPPPPDLPPPPKPRTEVRRDARGCAYGANRVGEVSTARLERAIICLINHKRAAHDLSPVRRVGSLDVAADRHARDLVRRRYFAHRSRSGTRPADRARATGYIRKPSGWSIGEVLAWGTGRYAAPTATVDAWETSSGHRFVILHPSLRDIGVAVRAGIPAPGRRDGGTFVAELGRR